MSMGSFRNYLKNPKRCRQCPDYKQERSEIASRSNSSRKLLHHIYEPFLDDVISGKKTFLEIAQILGLDDSSVCKWFHSHHGIKSKHGNKSLQEDRVFAYLTEIFGECKRSVRYGAATRHIADFVVPSIGFVEYDGAGFYHHAKKADDYVDKTYSPARLTAQAYFGGKDYIRYKLTGAKTGYCAAASPKEYAVKQLDKISPANDLLENCHVLKSTAGKLVFGLYFGDLLIGVAKFGNSTSPADNDMLELRRFFVLDGTPRNTESWFLDKCMKLLPKDRKLVTFVHHNEKGSYLKALGWVKQPNKQKDYDFYLINGKLISKRTMWGWAKKVGLVDKVGTTMAKEVLSVALGGTKITEPSKIKFIYEWAP